MAAFLAPLVGWGLNKIFGGGGGGTAKLSPTSPTFRRAEQLGDTMSQWGGGYALPEGKKLLGEAESTLQKPLDYYSKLLSGNRQEMLQAEAPEINTMRGQTEQAKANIGKFTPQGGGQTALLSELPFRESAAETNLLNTVRPQAAKGLQEISSEQGALSGMVTGEGLQAENTALNAISDQINALLGKSAQDIPLMQQSGAGVYQMLNQLMNGGSPPPTYGGASSVPGYDPNSGADISGALGTIH